MNDEICHIFVETVNGKVTGIKASNLPKNTQFNFVVRDLDDIELGDPDPQEVEGLTEEQFEWIY